MDAIPARDRFGTAHSRTGDAFGPAPTAMTGTHAESDVARRNVTAAPAVNDGGARAS